MSIDKADKPLTRADVIKLLQEAGSSDKLNLSYLNLTNIDLSNVDLSGSGTLLVIRKYVIE